MKDKIIILKLIFTIICFSALWVIHTIDNSNSILISIATCGIFMLFGLYILVLNELAKEIGVKKIIKETLNNELLPVIEVLGGGRYKKLFFC